MILFLISTLLIEPTFSGEPEDLLSYEKLSFFVKSHLIQKGIKTDEVEIRFPLSPAGILTSTLISILELENYLRTVEPIHPRTVARIANFRSNDTDYSCLVEARLNSKAVGGGVDIGLTACSPAQLPNGANLPGLFALHNDFSNVTTHRRFIAENQTKPDDETRGIAPTTEQKSVLPAN